MSSQFDVAIVGAGIVGLAAGAELLSRVPGISIAVLEKEAEVAQHQTGHNSGVIHSGIYYKPGSLKSQLCVEGARSLLHFCREHEIDHEVCGKVIVATEAAELSGLSTLFDRGRQNGLQGLRMLNPCELARIEPNARGLAAIHVPGTGIVDYGAVARKLARLIEAAGGAILRSHLVTGFRKNNSGLVLETQRAAVEAKVVLNCAGLHSDRVSRMAQAKLDLTIVPFRGEYYDLRPEREGLVRGLIYPVPDPRFPFLGVHFTRRIGGGVEAGPNAVLALKREGYKKTSLDVGDVTEFLYFGGFWRMAHQHWRTSVGEVYRSWSKAAFVRALQRLMPAISEGDLVPGGAGVRAQALDQQGRLLDDFHFVYSDRMVHVCNVPSPAATASLAIGRCIVDHLLDQHGSLLRATCFPGDAGNSGRLFQAPEHVMQIM